MNTRILSHQQKIDNLFKKISTISDPSDQSEWSRYLCILVSGYLEESLRVLLEEYATKQASPNIQNFVTKQVQKITNCKVGKIEDILSQFSSQWKEAFINQTSQEIKNSINSVINNRHSIAHGRNSGITYITINKYYTDVKKVVEILENLIK